MDVDQMLRDARTERADLESQLAAVDKLIVALEAMTGPRSLEAKAVVGDATEKPDYPRPREAILQAILKLTPGRPVEPRHVTSIVRDLGLFNPDLKSGPSAYSTALSRLADEPDSEIRRQGDFYVFEPADSLVLTGMDAVEKGNGVGRT